MRVSAPTQGLHRHRAVPMLRARPRGIGLDSDCNAMYVHRGKVEVTAIHRTCATASSPPAAAWTRSRTGQLSKRRSGTWIGRTFDINWRASVRLAELAKAAGCRASVLLLVQQLRRVGRRSRERDRRSIRSRLRVRGATERDVAPLADESFCRVPAQRPASASLRGMLRLVLTNCRVAYTTATAAESDASRAPARHSRHLRGSSRRSRRRASAYAARRSTWRSRRRTTGSATSRRW